MAQLVTQAETKTRNAEMRTTQPGLLTPDRPTLAAGVQLVGELQGSGFKTRQWLIQRDGRFLQLTELLYRLLELCNGEHDLEQIARRLSEAMERQVMTEQVRYALETMLIPRGLVISAAGDAVPMSQPRLRSPLLVNMRVRMIGPGAIDPIARVLRLLFVPPVLIATVIAIAAAHYWVYGVHGLASSFRAALFMPGGLLVILALLIAAGLFHELGHAAALRYAGARARGIGAGLYLVYPVFYTDATESYRLGRWARLRTDLGGIYFHLVFALAIVGITLLSGQDFLLLAVLLIDLSLIRQFLPFIRMDGYWALADLTGLPDFFSLMGPLVQNLMPGFKAKNRRANLPDLKSWAKAVFVMYVMVSLPLLAIMYVALIKGLPYMVETTWGALGFQATTLLVAGSVGDVPRVFAALIQMVFLVLPIIGLSYMLYASGGRMVRKLWTWSRINRARRALGACLAGTAAASLALMWLPQLHVDQWHLEQLPFGRPAVPTGVETFNITDRAHAGTGVDYSQTPPVAGNHAPVWINCGFYADEIPSENAVHSMEHGAVWITYSPMLDQSQVSSLRAFAQREPYVLVSKYSDLSSPVVASAWNRQLRLESVNDPRLEQFVRAFEEGSQAPESGGPCTGGTGRPAL